MKKLVSKIYHLLPLKQQLFSVIKLFGTPSERIYKHLHFNGVFTVSVDSAHSFKMRHYGFEVENTLFWKGIEHGFENKSLILWSQLARDSDVIFDIGANTGIYSLIAKSVRPQAKVYAVEPIKRVFVKLLENNKLNNYDINCLEFGASNEDGVATIYDFPGEHSYSSTFHREIFQDDGLVQIQVAVKKLKTFIEEEKVEKIDLMKIDVEGHETEVLEGFGEFLDKFKPTMLIEILTDEVGRKVEELLAGKDYLYFYIDEETAECRKVGNLTRRDSYNYLVCCESMAQKLKLKF
jgi:FkbM family methyltransferase